MSYWYQYFVGECPVCGKVQSYKVRRYSKKPKTHEARFVQIPYDQVWCGCGR